MEEKLLELKIEDFIWVIYLGIIILSWYSNNLERKYFINNDLKALEKYRNIMLIIFTILIIVYLYYFISSYKDIIEIDFSNMNETDILKLLSLIASLLVLISGIIYIYIIYKDKQLEVEIAFN